MPPSSTKPPSPAELAKLEAAFATDPGSETYKPLAEAYLSMGRFMEAMVVCKKGVKAHPTKPDPRILLARVYADQGKDKKALEELQGALQIAPDDRVALRMTGSLQLKNGEPEAGKANLLKAYEKDPNDSDTLAALSQHNIAVAKAAPPPPPEPVPQLVAPPAQAVGAPAQAVGGGGGYVAPPQPPPTLVPNAAAQPARAPAQPQRVNGSHAQVEAPAPRREAPRPAPRRAEPRYDYDEDEVSGRHQKPKSKAPMVMFMLLLIGGGLGVGVYTFLRKQQRDNVIAVKRIMDGVDKELRHDSYPSYQKIAEQSEKALEIIPDNVPAHGQAAYAYTILWGEHGGGDAAQKKAQEHLEAAEKGGGGTSASLVAARALFDTYSGKGKEARINLEGVIKDAEDRGVAAAAQVYLAHGIIAMQQGDLAKAKESLDKAQKAASGDPRVYAALGNLYQRMGQDSQAELNFIYALRYEKGHPESMLGSALLELDKEEPDYKKVALILKTLTEAEPAPSPRQLATAHLARAYMISRVSNELQYYKPEFQKEITEATKVPTDKSKAQAEVVKAEQLGFGLDKSNPELKLIKSKRLLAEKNTDGAVAEVREAIKQDPSRAQFYVELAKSLMAKEGGEKEATEALRTAIKSMGESPRLSVMLGQVLMKQGKTDEAITELQKATSGKGKNPDARLMLGRALREKRQTDKAIETLLKASEEFLGNNPMVSETQVELGRAYEDKGDKGKAETAYQAAINADGQYGDGYFFYGKFMSSDPKSKGKVKELMKKYLELDPRGRYADDAKRIGGL